MFNKYDLNNSNAIVANNIPGIELLDYMRDNGYTLTSKDYTDDLEEAMAQIGVTKGEPMSFEQAIENNIKTLNPYRINNYNPGASANCAIASILVELRYRGYDVMALPADVTYNPENRTAEYNDEFARDLSFHLGLKWADPETHGDTVFHISNGYSVDELLDMMNRAKIGERYIAVIPVAFDGNMGMHYVFIDKTEDDQIRLTDAQHGKCVTGNALVKYLAKYVCEYNVFLAGDMLRERKAWMVRVDNMAMSMDLVQALPNLITKFSKNTLKIKLDAIKESVTNFVMHYKTAMKG